MSIKQVFFSALAGVGLSLAATGVSADNTKQTGSGPNPYRDCGIGAALFPDTHWAAITSNVIWDLGITALTSATASPETCSGKKVAAAKFISETYASLVDETARGGGEHVTAVLEIYGCAANTHEAVTAAVRQEMAQRVAMQQYTHMSKGEKAEQYYLILDRKVQQGFAASCAV